MKKIYFLPETEAVGIFFEGCFLQSGGTQSGTGSGSDMDDPDPGQNPF